jgi:hypothetical protein
VQRSGECRGADRVARVCRPRIANQLMVSRRCGEPPPRGGASGHGDDRRQTGRRHAAPRRGPVARSRSARGAGDRAAPARLALRDARARSGCGCGWRCGWPAPDRSRSGFNHAVGSSCPRPNTEPRFTGRLCRIATLRRLPTRPAATGRRLTLNLRLAPGIHRLTVRAHLDRNRLSLPARRFPRAAG